MGKRSRRRSCTKRVLSVREEERRKAEGGTNLCVFLRRRQQLRQVLVPLLLVVPSLPPLRDRVTVEDEDVEEGVEEEDAVGLDRDRVEKDGFGGSFEGVGHERRLNHDERVVDVFGVEDVAVEGLESQ
jgi:hypothetical protein